MTKSADKDSASTVRRIAFWFWTILIVRFSFTVLFFQDSPKIATFLSALTSVLAGFVLVMIRLSAPILSRPMVWPSAIKWVMLYVAWAGASLYWTFSDTLGSAIGYYLMMLLDIIVVMVTLKWGDIDEVAISSLKGWVIGTLAIDVIALLFTHGDENGRLGNPDFLHPGNLGHFTSVAGLISIFFWRSAPRGGLRQTWWAIITMVLWWFLIMTLSKTSLVAFVCAAAFSIIFGSGLPLKAKLKAVAAGLAVMLMSYGLLSNYYSVYVDETPQDAATLSGRTILWIKSWEMIEDRPMLGYGFLSFRNYAPQDWDVRTTHGHNEWVTQAFQLGAVGVILTFAIYLAYFRYLRKVGDSLRRDLGFALLIYMLIEGMAIAEPVGLLFPLPLIVLIVTWAGADSRCAAGHSAPMLADARAGSQRHDMV